MNCYRIAFLHYCVNCIYRIILDLYWLSKVEGRSSIWSEDVGTSPGFGPINTISGVIEELLSELIGPIRTFINPLFN